MMASWQTFDVCFRNTIDIHRSNIGEQERMQTCQQAVTTARSILTSEVGVETKIKLSQHVLFHFEKQLRKHYDEQIWSNIGDEAAMGRSNISQSLTDSLLQIENIRNGHFMQLELFARGVSGFGDLVWLKEVVEDSKNILSAVILETIPKNFEQILLTFYEEKFREFTKDVESQQTERTSCMQVDSDSSHLNTIGKDWLSKVAFVGQSLNEIGLGSISEDAYTEIIFNHLRHWIQDKCAQEFSKECLAEVQRYNQTVTIEFLKLLLPRGEKSQNPSETMLSHWKSRLDFFTYEVLGKIRVDEMFDIVVEFPDSKEALQDLKICLEQTDNTEHFVRSFSGQLNKRLLHLGATTGVILAQYLSSIKALNILDPSGILVELICPLMKEYIKTRKEATRCIVNMIICDEGMLNQSNTDENGMDMNLDFGNADEDGDDIDIILKEMKWEPIPIQAAQLFDTVRSCNQDMVSALIDILGNKEYFIKEYKMVLAERLLSKVDDDIDDETKILELLKIRFGANSLRDCEIMLKDIADSKRITGSIKALNADHPQELAKLDSFSTIILSELFWPPLFEGDLQVPVEVKHATDLYGGRYQSLKAPRSLHYKQHLGVVELELCFGNEVKNITVSAAQASIILQFQTKKIWEVTELAKATGLTVESVKDKIVVWINSGIISKDNDRTSEKLLYTLIDDVEKQVQRPYAHTEPDVSVMSVEQQMELNMKVYESYIMGMVTNLESLPIEKIHNMLKMFVFEPVYDKTINELESFLEKLVNDGKLTFDGMLYRKKK